MSYTIDLATGEETVPKEMTIEVDDRQVAAELAALLECPIAVPDDVECA